MSRWIVNASASRSPLFAKLSDWPEKPNPTVHPPRRDRLKVRSKSEAQDVGLS